MGYNFIECDRDTAYLLSPLLQEWLPAGHVEVRGAGENRAAGGQTVFRRIVRSFSSRNLQLQISCFYRTFYNNNGIVQQTP